MELGFYGATQTVTGSKFLLRAGKRELLVDCGLFQGYKQLRRRNWAALPFSAKALDGAVLTHAHIDHSGALPLLVKAGYRGAVDCTTATRALCRILLPDSGRIHEADAAYANRKGFSKHHPALPLYTEEDAQRTLRHLRVREFGERFSPAHGFEAQLSRAGHILGAASVCIEVEGRRIQFSGDLGRDDDPLIRAPAPREGADYVVIEATYGDRHHGEEDPGEALAKVVNEAAARGGTLVIPAFSVGRTQTLLLLLERLRAAGSIPRLPIYLDSPMAISATELYRDHPSTHRLSAAQCSAMCAVASYVREVEDSKALDRRDDPIILISASGMATGGRVVHHLRRFAPDPNNTILFAGYQAGGTRGAKLLAGADRVRIHGEWVPVRAQIESLDMLSAHADQDGLIKWLRSCERAPRKVFVVHADVEAAEHMRVRIEDELGWGCEIPEYRERVAL
ncbi:MBL fold metallo-hydrolase [Pseudenhygromyxa sp. WMMC2535]|uniref:MBL fold metallo-hydrolase RNA specificity domain-containing protein n=1 Tax=Pseudenhygromyxa sp. WMMC2535 TaxID=2712867 RepID=UPI001552D414|nr:MBL fold metallo-hydrolase [Pseudenhygromyxa sp. WMMC2535]